MTYSIKTIVCICVYIWILLFDFYIIILLICKFIFSYYIFSGQGKPVGKVIAVDKQHCQPIQGAQILIKDFTKATTKEEILLGLLNGQKAHVVLSDMAPSPSGLKSLDHQVICSLATDVLRFAREVLTEGGHFLCKIWQGADQKKLHNEIANNFRKVKVIKPSASRSESAEMFLLGQGYKGMDKEKLDNRLWCDVYLVCSYRSLCAFFCCDALFY